MLIYSALLNNCVPLHMSCSNFNAYFMRNSPLRDVNCNARCFPTYCGMVFGVKA